MKKQIHRAWEKKDEIYCERRNVMQGICITACQIITKNKIQITLCPLHHPALNQGEIKMFRKVTK